MSAKETVKGSESGASRNLGGVRSRYGKSEQSRRKPGKSEREQRHSRDDVLFGEDWERLVRAAKSPVERLYVRLCGIWGLRSGEAAHVSLAWISSQSGELRIPLFCRCRSCQESGARHWTPKTPAGSRLLPVAKDPGTWIAIKEVFGKNPDRGPVSERAVHKTIKRVADRAGFLDRNVYPHALRATAATRFASKGLKEMALCRLMGWQYLDSAQPYIQMAGVDVGEALEGVDLGI